MRCIFLRKIVVAQAGGLLVREPNFGWCGPRCGIRLVFLLAFAASLAILSSCGGSSSSTITTTPSITVSCAASQVTLLQTDQCTATVLNLSSTLVNWTISGSDTGSIDSTGLYKAPASFPTDNVVTVTATAQAQTSLTATSTITITQPTAINAVTCVDPTNNNAVATTVSSGNQLACSATTSGGTIVPVFWSVNTTANGNSTIGRITTQGVYTAPLVPPTPQTVTITATSQALSTQTMSVMVAVVFGNGVLTGPYAFSTSGRIANPANPFFVARVGAFTLGGGALVGTEDTSQGGASGAVTVRMQRTFTGSYSIGPDGRGTMQFCEDTGASCPAGSPAATSFFRIVVLSPQQAQMIEFSSPPPATTSASTSAGGEMISQDTSVYGAGNGNLSGAYTFNFAGVSATGTEESAVGEFAANGHGTIGAGVPSAPGPGAPGEIVINGGAVQTFSSPTSYSISSDRGTATLGGLTFSFYMVSAGRAKFMEIDSPPSSPSSSILVGDAYKQQTGLACGWGLNVLSGPTVFETSGVSSGVQIGDVGSFTATAGAISAASIDENSGGTVSQQTGSAGDNYTVDSCGRGTMAIGGHSYIFYPISVSSAVLQEKTSGIVAHGLLVQSQGGPFADGSLSGSYALRLGGTNAPGAAGLREDTVGQLSSDGAGAVSGGSLDINSFGTTQTGVAIGGTYLPTPAGTLRATMLLSPTRNLVLYLVSPTQFYVLDTDGTGTAIGSLDKQF
jgi:hypothetical protein